MPDKNQPTANKGLPPFLWAAAIALFVLATLYIFSN